MKRLMIVRHGQSMGNKEKVIQGGKYDYGLTEFGMNEIHKVAQKNKRLIHKVDKIITSPTKRTIETAEILNQYIQKEIKCNPQVIEFNPGILAENTHQYNKMFYPEYYDIWIKRGDLDGIPNAEKGEELQARVIAFLSQYIGKENFNDLIVSHAGFIRCFVNTIKSRDRQKNVPVENGCLYIIDDPFKHLEITYKKRAMSSKVYIVKTNSQNYVVKIKDRNLIEQDFSEQEVLDKIGENVHDIPKMLYLSNILEEQKSVKVYRYLSGKHIYGKLREDQKEVLVDKIKQIKTELNKIDTTKYEKIDLYNMIKEKMRYAKNHYLIEIGNEILNNTTMIERMQKSEYCLVHDDLNRDNILFNYEDGRLNVSIIDWESLKLLPKEYQLAVFLTCSLLIEGEKIEDILNINKKLDEDFDIDYVIYLMKIRLFMGINFFSENEYINGIDKTIANGILKKYFLANENLEEYLKKYEKKLTIT